MQKKKMYKKGKFWVVATVATATAVIGSGNVSADETVAPSANQLETLSPSVASVASPNAVSAKEEEEVVENNSERSTAASPTTDADETEVDASPEQVGAIAETAGTVETAETRPETVEETAARTLAKANLSQLSETAQKIVAEAGLSNQEVASLTQSQIAALNKMQLTSDAEAGTRMTYKDFAAIAQALVDQDSRYAIPFFNAATIENMAAATTVDAQTNKIGDLDVWDSWAVQNPRTKLVENWNGYQLAVAMMGLPGVNDNHLYLVYNKYGDNNLQNWKNAGSIFGYGLDELTQQWSGSAIVNSDGSIQLFYTKVDTTEGTNHQKIASITLNLDHDDETVWIKSTENDQVIFEGDGYYYQTYEQWKATNRGADNIAMRDAHIVEEENGDRYLVFEASTGTQNYQGESQIYSWLNYGGDAAYNVKSLFQILGNEDITSRATWANAAIGILKLTNDEKLPQVEKLLTPLVTANMVSDEIERPSVVKLGNKYYLFAASRLNRGSNDDAWYAANKAVGDNVVMVGYVSDNLVSGYKPLNTSGVVLTASVPADWRTATYSYYAMPVEGSEDTVLITSYMTNRHGVAGTENKATWAPSFLVKIFSDGTTRVLAKMTQQGDWIWDASSETTTTVGTFDTSRLPGEDFIVDWELIGYNLKDHEPLKDNEPNTPNNPDVPNVPNNPDAPLIPTNPEVPNTPTTPETPTPTPTPGRDNGEIIPVAKASILPATGTDASDTQSTAIGLLTLVMTVLAGLSYRQKSEKES